MDVFFFLDLFLVILVLFILISDCVHPNLVETVISFLNKILLLSDEIKKMLLIDDEVKLKGSSCLFLQPRRLVDLRTKVKLYICK